MWYTIGEAKQKKEFIMLINRSTARELIREYLDTNNCIYTAVIGHSIDWTETFTTETEAMTTLYAS